MNPSSMPPGIPDYELLRPIGGGSYGEVWLARGVTGVLRAVKLVSRERFRDERPFLRELDGISRFQEVSLGQPRQLALLHVGRDLAGERFHYVMELADDAETGADIDPARYVPLTLKELVRRRGKLSASESLRLAVDLTRALAGLHELGLIHRDIKPSNIIFVQGVPKLADIGLVSSADHTLTSVGTPGYLPPEGAGSIRADIFSLGRVLYELLTGLSSTEFPRLPADATVRPDAEAFFELNEVVLRAGDPDIGQRYESADAMLDELLLLQAGRSLREMAATKERLAQLRIAVRWMGGVALAALVGLGIKDWRTSRRLYAQEAAYRQQAEAREAEARYAADLQVAQLGLAAGDLGVARSALRRHVPTANERDRRGFEWYALNHEAQGDAASVLGETGGQAFHQVAVSPNGGRVAALRRTGPREGEVLVWELASGKLLRQFTGLFDLGGFLGDGERLIASTYAKELQVLDPRSDAGPASQSASNQLVNAVHDGRTFVLAERREGYRFQLWDAVAGRETARVESGPEMGSRVLAAAAASLDRTRIAASFFWTEGLLYRRELVVWNLASGQTAFRTSEVERVWALAFSRDGRQLAVGMAGAPIMVLDAERGGVLQRLTGHNGRVLAIAFSPDGQSLASAGSDQSVRVWEVATGKEMRRFVGHEAAVRGVAWFPEGDRLVSAGEDGSVRVWSGLANNRPLVLSGLWNSTLGDFVVSPDESRLLVTDREGELVSVTLSNLMRATRLPSAFQGLVWGPQETNLLALTTDQVLHRWDTVTGRSEPTGLSLPSRSWIRSFAVSASGKLAAFGDAQGRVVFWDLAQLRELGTVTNHSRRVMGIGFAPNDALAATGDDDGRLWLWEMSGLMGRELAPLGMTIHSVAFTPDGMRIAVGLEDGRIRVRSRLPEGGREVMLQAHSREVSQLVFSPDGARMVSAGYDGLIVFWTVPGFRRLVSLPFESQPAAAGDVGLLPVKFAGNGNLLGAYASDGRLRLWRGR